MDQHDRLTVPWADVHVVNPDAVGVEETTFCR
jgi:hypothetical protein